MASPGTSPKPLWPSCLAGSSSLFPMLTSTMALPTGSSSLPISSPADRISFSAETPQVLELGGVNLKPTEHCLIPWVHHWQEMLQKGLQTIGSVSGIEHAGIEWIYGTPSGNCGNARRLVYNARELFLNPWAKYLMAQDKLKELVINEGDFTLRTALPGILIPPGGRYFPPGSLQIILDDQDRQILDDGTTLPRPELVSTVNCNGWWKKQHIYIDHGMTEKAVVFFNRFGWPIACRENMLDAAGNRSQARWWRFDYSRPLPVAEEV